ncbi:MAG: hypothetical protein KKB37_08230 [Alphaproteobacteria bacterium]|nr:hypothetical protein [Alphaproteobacteria bacterium]
MPRSPGTSATLVPLLARARAELASERLFDSALVFWRGTSGHAYAHTIYNLAGCPEIPASSVMFVLKHDHGRREVLDVMCVDHEAPSLNLAFVRQNGARLGANEVHLHFATGDSGARQTAMIDLRTRHGHAVIGV